MRAETVERLVSARLSRCFDAAGPERLLQFGFSAQSPTGHGSTVTFSDIHYKPEALKFWSGEEKSAAIKAQTKN